jgi:pimeloyl-ACP methyl ester carboxylesterase
MSQVTATRMADRQSILASIAELKAEIEERCPEYFDYNAIRVRGQRGLKTLERIGAALGIDIYVCAPDSEVNAVDAMFEDAISPCLGELDTEDVDWFPSTQFIRPPVDRPISDLLPARSAGGDLVYYAGGMGPDLVIVNALSSKLDYWTRLIPLLMGQCRLVIWQLREDPNATLMDHVADLGAIARAERLESFDVLGWCTGPKIAMEYWRRNLGAVRSMIFLNGSLKASTRADEDETEHERNLGILCRAVVDHPELAATMMKALRQIEGPDPSSPMEVLAAPNATLRDTILYPFRDQAATAVYVRQMLDFLTYDVRELAPQVDLPMLWIASEYDQIASPRGARRNARLFPRGEYVEIKSATHYVLFDRPKAVVEPAVRFLQSVQSRRPAATIQ